MTMLPRFKQMTPSSLRRLREAPTALYVMAYDIADDRRRHRIARLAEGLGHRAQKSVFLVELSAVELESTLRRLHRIIDPEFDTVILAPSSSSEVVTLGNSIRITTPGLVVA